MSETCHTSWEYRARRIIHAVHDLYLVRRVSRFRAREYDTRYSVKVFVQLLQKAPHVSSPLWFLTVGHDVFFFIFFRFHFPYRIISPCFSTELPKERADWLFTLAEYHKMLNNDAEQGRCLVEIYQGFKRLVGFLLFCRPVEAEIYQGFRKLVGFFLVLFLLFVVQRKVKSTRVLRG